MLATPPSHASGSASRRRSGAARVAQIFWLAAALLLSACQALPSSAGRLATTVTVSAAADLTPAFQEIGKLYEQQTGNQVVFNFGSTGQLAQQIDKGAPVDVFAAANESYVDDLDKKGLVEPGTKKLYATGRITLWTRAGSPLHLDQLEDLTAPEIRHIAIANPDHAPYGVAAREALQAAGVWENVQSKLVFGENATQTLQLAQTGNVDAAILPLSLSVQGNGQWVLIPENLHTPLRQAVAVIRGTAHEREARAFVDFVSGPQGRQIMRNYGFVLPGEEPVK